MFSVGLSGLWVWGVGLQRDDEGLRVRVDKKIVEDISLLGQGMCKFGQSTKLCDPTEGLRLRVEVR